MHLVTPFFELDIEFSWFLLMCAMTIIGSVVEWRRGGSEVRELRIDVEVLKQTTASVEDWAQFDTRCTVLERLVETIMRNGESDGDDDGDDAED